MKNDQQRQAQKKRYFLNSSQLRVAKSSSSNWITTKVAGATVLKKLFSVLFV